jgi:hypothetical protein
MREIMNAKQTQSIPATPARGGCGGLVQSRSRHLAESAPYRINDPWLSCRLEANALIEQGFEPASDIGLVKRACGKSKQWS